jgi:hypothetical protein
MKHLRTALNGLALICIAGLTACATPGPQGLQAAAAGCADNEITAEQLVGTWRVSLSGQPGSWTLVLRPHPEHEGSLRGALMQNPQHYAVAADLEDGEFTMEESRDGQRIAATWLGKVQASSCGQRIAGERQDSTGAAERFEMRSERLR